MRGIPSEFSVKLFRSKEFCTEVDQVEAELIVELTMTNPAQLFIDLESNASHSLQGPIEKG